MDKFPAGIVVTALSLGLVLGSFMMPNVFGLSTITELSSCDDDAWREIRDHAEQLAAERGSQVSIVYHVEATAYQIFSTASGEPWYTIKFHTVYDGEGNLLLEGFKVVYDLQKWQSDCNRAEVEERESLTEQLADDLVRCPHLTGGSISCGEATDRIEWDFKLGEVDIIDDSGSYAKTPLPPDNADAEDLWDDVTDGLATTTFPNTGTILGSFGAVLGIVFATVRKEWQTVLP